jgi:thiosulfate dehydrogenase [quinone] large subunit
MFKSLFHNVEVQDPPIAKFLFNNTASAIIWLVVRVWLGFQWIQAAQHKLISPDWMVTGNALKGYWMAAVTTDPKPVIYFDWYRGFIQFLLDTHAYTWFAQFVAVGELLVGIALILGAFTGIAAFFGALMNWNYLLAGTTSSNPLLFVLAIALILAWKVAGYYGVDRWLLPLLGTPWKFGTLLSPKNKTPETAPQPVR